MKDDFGDRMKYYEGLETDRALNWYLPVCVRIDGRSFSKFTAGFPKPFSTSFGTSMCGTAKILTDKLRPNLTFVQSDEISMVFYKQEPQGFLFDGKIQKLTSVIASLTASIFVQYQLPEDAVKFPHFDCRVWNVPISEMSNVMLWREKDAIRNGLTTYARYTLGHKKIMYQSQADLIEYLGELGKYDNFMQLEPHYRKGSWFKPINVTLDDGAIRTHISEVMTGIKYGELSYEERQYAIASKDWFC